MNATCQGKDLLNFLKLLKPFCISGSALLSAVKNETRGQFLQVGVSELDLGGVVHCPATIQEEGNFVVHLDKLYGLISKWTGALSLVEKDGVLTISGSGAKVILQVTSTSVLKKFRKPPSTNLPKLPLSTVLLFQQTLVSTDDTWGYVQLEHNPETNIITAAATNRYILTIREIEVTEELSSFGPWFFPATLLNFPYNFFKTTNIPANTAVRIGEDDTHFYIIVGNDGMFYTPKLQATRRVAHEQIEQLKPIGSFKVNRATLLQGVRQCAPVSETLSFIINENETSVFTKLRKEEVHWPIEIEEKWGEISPTTIIDNKQLTAALSSMISEKVELRFTNRTLVIVPHPQHRCHIAAKD